MEGVHRKQSGVSDQVKDKKAAAFEHEASADCISPAALLRLRDLHRLVQAEHLLVEDEPALHVRREQEVFLRVLMTVATELQRKFRMREQITDLVGAALDRMHQRTGELMDHLSG